MLGPVLVQSVINNSKRGKPIGGKTVDSSVIFAICIFFCYLLPSSVVYRIQVNEYGVLVCPLPGNRMGGARRSLAADLGKDLLLRRMTTGCSCVS